MFHSTNTSGATRRKRLPVGVILPCSFSYSVPRDFCRRKEGALFTARTLTLNDLSIETQTIERRVTPSNRVLYVTRDMYLCVSRFDRKLFSFSFFFSLFLISSPAHLFSHAPFEKHNRDSPVSFQANENLLEFFHQIFLPLPSSVIHDRVFPSSARELPWRYRSKCVFMRVSCICKRVYGF